MQTSKVLAMLAVAAVLAGCAGGGKAQQHAAAAPPLAVGVVHAERGEIARTVTLDGQIVPLLDSTLSFQQSGPITAIYVNVGDRVSKGELLAAIDASTLRAQLAQFQAQADQAAARARSSQVGIPITQAQTSAAVEAAKAAVVSTGLTYRQDQQLYRQGYVSQSALQDAQSAYVQAQSQYRAAVANGASNQATQLNAQADLATERAARAQVRTLRTQIAQTELRAPFDGVVTARLMDPGAMAGPATAVLRVSQVQTVWLNLNVPDADLAYARTGTTLAFRTPSLPGRSFTARIGAINAVPSQGTLSYQAQARIPNPGGVLRGGMLVTAVLTQERHAGVIVVPLSALVQSPQGAAVFVVANGKAARVAVRVGLETDTQAEVAARAIVPGTQIVARPPESLQDGAAVAVSAATGSDTAQ
ncbi:efflux RND transporter periplasmic adaptor subunit [bacterium]|nr:MAG: efflux RND transporter periplasmic adaptor subunit [bacterium]